MHVTCKPPWSKYPQFRQPLVFLCVTTIATILPLLSSAQDTPDPEPQSRILNGHQFIPSTRLFDPFINTWVRQTTGFGSAKDVVTVVDDLEGDPVEFVGNVSFLGIAFAYQHALSDRIAAYLTAGGGARVGTDAEAILSSGLNAFVDFSLGGKVKVWGNQNFLLSANLDYANTGVSSVSVLNWAREVVDSGALSDSSLVASSSTGSFRGGLNLSYAPAPWIGFTGLTLFGLGNAVGDLESEFAFQGQISTDIDLNPVNNVPIGFILGYDRNTFVQQGGEITDSINAFIFGIFYTGRDDFNIGLEFQNAKLPLKQVDKSIRTSEASINLRYFF
jgi:hypothetical protein